MINIQWLVEDSGLEGVEYVCGNEYAKRSITGVHIMDNPDTHQFFKQGEIVLTTGYLFKQMKDSDIVALIKTMKEKGCCCIAFKIHRFYDNVPEIIVNEALKYEIPILSLPYELALSDVQMAVLRKIFELEQSDMKQDETSNFFDHFFNDEISTDELEYLCIKNCFNTKSRHCIIVFDIVDISRQRQSIERGAFIRHLTYHIYLKNSLLVVACEVPDMLGEVEINECMREFAIECSDNYNLGVSEFGDYLSIARLYLQAVKSKNLNILLKDKRTITYSEQVIYHFMLESVNEEELRRIAIPLVTKLDAEMLDTIEELVLSGWKYKETADKLYIHRNTLMFRKGKIYNILGWEESPSHTTMLELAVYAYRILKYVKNSI